MKGVDTSRRGARGYPDFVIAGAAKCGTTALYAYLTAHPQVAMSSRKEPYFWCPDIPVPDAVADPATYAALWQHAPADGLRGEATPAYIRSATAAARILASNPGTRFVVMLRNPTEMAASYHAQMLFSLHETEASFHKAWALQERRRRGKSIPVACPFPPDLQYAEVCALGDQLERMTAIVPPQQLKVVLLDDLRADPRRVYLEVLLFLGLEDDGRTHFAPVNQNRRRKALPLTRLARRVGASRPLARLRLSRLIDRLSAREGPRQPLDPHFAATLHAFFLPQVEKLETLLDRNLDAWKSPR